MPKKYLTLSELGGKFVIDKGNKEFLVFDWARVTKKSSGLAELLAKSADMSKLEITRDGEDYVVSIPTRLSITLGRVREKGRSDGR